MTMIGKAGAAPTAHLISELEKIGFKPVHVYGSTSVVPSFIFGAYELTSHKREVTSVLGPV